MWNLTTGDPSYIVTTRRSVPTTNKTDYFITDILIANEIRLVNAKIMRASATYSYYAGAVVTLDTFNCWVTRNGTGDYKINFIEKPFPSQVYYHISFSGNYDAGSSNSGNGLAFTPYDRTELYLSFVQSKHSAVGTNTDFHGSNPGDARIAIFW